MFESIQPIPVSTVFILLLSMALTLVTSLANRFLTNQNQLRAWRQEIAEWTAEFNKARKTQDKKLLAKVKKKQVDITKIQSKMTWQSMKVSLIFMIPFFLLWTLFLNPTFGLTAVAYIPNILEGGSWIAIPLFWWYLLCSFLFGTLFAKVLGLAVGAMGTMGTSETSKATGATKATKAKGTKGAKE
jgi:uncharacterized membrane protein (DUF106 family)